MERSLHRPRDHSAAYPRLDATASREEPIEIAPGVWWVGVRLASDHFQCHTSVIANGSDGVLIDPGSPFTNKGTLAKLRANIDLGAIRWLVCHHSAPDICAALPRLAEVFRHLQRREALEVAARNTTALCDPHTGLANRRTLEEAKLPASDSLIELDSDQCKQVIDSFGHDAGDRVRAADALALSSH